MTEAPSLTITITYGSLRSEFTGSPEQVLHAVTSFLAKNIPHVDLAQRITLNYSATELVSNFAPWVRLTPEGPRVWSTTSPLSDKHLVALQLVANRIAQETGRGVSSHMSLADLQTTTSLKPKSISSRLSELTKVGHVQRHSDADGIKYSITTQGIAWLLDSLSTRRAGK